MTGLFLDIEPYLVDPEVEAVEQAEEELLERYYTFYPSLMNYCTDKRYSITKQ